LSRGWTPGWRGFGKPLAGAAPIVVETTSPERRVALDLHPAVTAGRQQPTRAPMSRSRPARLRLVYGRLDPAHTP